MLEITSELCEGYKNIYLLNGLSLNSIKSFYKYMPYSRFISSIINDELVFVSPEIWIDPFERRFWKTDYTRYSFTQPNIYCMCLTTKSTTNEEAAWKMYVDSKERALRITFNVDILLKKLDDYARESGNKIYIGKAIYCDRKRIVNLHNEDNIFFPKSDFTLEHYLSLMCLKRKSFEFENEIRIFIVKDGDSSYESLLKVKAIFDKEFIQKVMIGPMPPFSSEDPRYPLYNKIQYIESNEFKRKISSLINGCNIKQSMLYNIKDSLDRV